MRLVSLLVCFSYVYAKHGIYDGHALFKVRVKNLDQMEYITYIRNALELDIWIQPIPGKDGLILVPKQHIERFQKELQSMAIEFDMEVENIKVLLDLEDKLMEEVFHRRHTKPRASRIGFDRIYNLTEVAFYLEDLAAAYPDTVSVVSAGKSFEGRNIKYVKISTTNFKDITKPIVCIVSVLHAREWITLAASLYAIHKLVVNVTERDLVDNIDWIILPIANPDGYEFSHTENRFWRKNRATGIALGDYCMGVDLNRNFDVFWSQASSNNACSEVFHGRSAFSEPETMAIRDILLKYKDRIKLFIDLHSFGSMILYGWGTGALPGNVYDLHVLAQKQAKAIDAVKTPWNKDYKIGNVASIVYQASGSAMDFAKAIGVSLSFTYELPGFRKGLGNSGFLVDPTFIEQAGMETWEGIKTAARYARDMKSHYV